MRATLHARTRGLSAPEAMPRPTPWLVLLRRYLAFVALANLAWEVAHLPLYTIWQEGSPQEIAFAVAHCTLGDILIVTNALVLALVLCGSREWPEQSFARVATTTIIFGVCYTLFSEWLNVEVRRSWAYSDLMPVLPILGTGLSPLAQWIVIPLVAFRWAHREVAPYQLRTRTP